MSKERTTPTERGAWLAVLVLAGGLFAAVVSTTVVSVALPSIGRSLHAGPSQLQWIVDAYVLVYASLLVAGGVLGDRRGRKGLFMLGVAVFGAGSLLTGLATGTPLLLAGRVVQGIGPALLVPGSLTVIRAVFDDPRKRAVAIGLWSTSSGLALAVGPVLGGLIVDALGWRWVFLLNVPLSVLLVLLAARFIPRVPRVAARSRFDWAGAALSTAAVAAVAYATIEGRERGWGSTAIVAALAAGVAALTAFVLWERRRTEPLVDVRLFKRPAFTIANTAALVVFFSFVGAIVYFSVYFQQVQGRSPIEAGLDVAPIGVAFALAAQVSGRLVARIGARVPMLLGLLLSGAATLGLLRLGTDTGIGAIWWDFALAGAGIGLCLTPMTATAVAAVGAERAGMASAVHNALRQLGQVLGVAVLGALVYARTSAQGGGRRLGVAQQAAFVDGLHHAVWVCGLALLAAAVLAAFLPKVRPAAAPPAKAAVPVAAARG
ncbi:MFS transporter [Streptomyces gamaensis]|uniref:MFS transporter n=1 Tax=Streptomyces gamaensis TaxID=1763542 RepID=A0ABW0Z4X7_9ACTN